MTRGGRYIQLMKHLALLCALASLTLGACVDVAPDAEPGRISQPDLADVAATADELEAHATAIFLATHGEDAQVTFCCADEMCADGEFCDFDGGFVCAPRP